jgi:hypothetical protein
LFQREIVGHHGTELGGFHSAGVDGGNGLHALCSDGMPDGRKKGVKSP